MGNNIIFLAKNVSKSFGGVKALDKVTLSVERESMTLLMGPNGSGKTTFIQVAAGILAPDSGALVFEGRDITSLPPHLRFKLGIVSTFQIPRLFPSLSVLENVLVAARSNPSVLSAILRRSREEELIERAFEVLHFLTLDHLWDKPASALSGGQMKLLELAYALMSDPKLCLLDEPLAGVNPALAGEIMERLLEIRKELGVTVLIVEHRLDLALKYVDYAYAMHNGSVIAGGAPEEVVEHPEVVKAYLGE